MNSIKIIKTEWNMLSELTKNYCEELEYKNDGFHNYMMYSGEPYVINCDDEAIGFCSIGDSWDNGKMLRSFYIMPLMRGVSLAAFNKVIDKFSIEAAIVASNDSHFVSLAFEKMNAVNGSFDMQAFNFIYGKPNKKAQYGREYMEEVKETEYEYIEKVSEGQWDGCFDGKNKFYAIRKDNETLGYGSIIKLQNNEKNVDIGNYTLPQYRRKGVGRSLIINVAEIAIENGLIPVAGCYHGNEESVLTLTSSGFIPENRIFYIRFFTK